MAKSKKQRMHDLWDELKTDGDKYKPVWDDISKYTSITVDPDYIWHNNSSKSRSLDEFVDDPTSAISTIQAGDYLVGILWGSGEGVVDLVPSRYVLELEDKANLDKFYAFASDQLMYHMNHSEAGFHTSLKPYAYDQVSLGTSGIGVFPNNDFKNRIADNALTFRHYGVDNTRHAEGKNGIPDTVGVTYKWSTKRAIAEFAMTDGAFDQKKFDKLPKQVQKAHKAGDMNTEHNFVFLTFPRQDFDPRLKGKRGTRYRGVWFLDSDKDNKIFFEEDFAEKPISIARQIKVRGEAYGRASGTLLISSIRAVNFMISETIEILEKLGNPSLGIFNNALFGDSVLDTSPNGLTVFNSTMAQGAGGNPAFPVFDVGDPSGIIQFLIPYLNDKIVTGFKVDALLDFNSDKDMTATESLQRFVIRGKSLAGMLQQQKVEQLEPTVRRSVSILLSLGELGVDPEAEQGRARALVERGKENRVIPEAVRQVIRDGRPWYEMRFNNELERLIRTEAVQSLLQILNTIITIAAPFPDIIHAVNWYKLLKDINDNLDYNNQILLSKKEFKNAIAKIAEERQAAALMQAGQAGAAAQKDAASANKLNREAENVQR